MRLTPRISQFLLGDVAWVIGGQLIALCVGLLSLKIYTQLFSAVQYAYLALFTATAGWIWLGLYQPLNQTVFRFFPIAQQGGWKQTFLNFWQHRRHQLVITSLIIAMPLAALAASLDKWHYALLVICAACLGILSGQLHGIVSLFLSQRLRKPVAWIQSLDGISRLGGGLAAYYLFMASEQAVMVGMTLGAALMLSIARFLPAFRATATPEPESDALPPSSDVNPYLHRMFMLMLLNASIIHLDKWLMLPLLGTYSLGIYAIVHTLAMTLSTVMYGIFEMLFFPLVFHSTSSAQRKYISRLMILAFTINLLLVTCFVWFWGGQLLPLLTNTYVAEQVPLFTLLLAACGIFQGARLLMAQGQYLNQPHCYWPAYLGFMASFGLWCIAFVSEGALLNAGAGFFVGSIICLLITLIINLQLPKTEMGPAQ